LLSKIKKSRLRVLFLIILISSVIYIGLIKTSFYQSSASVLIKNMDENSQTTSLLGMIGGNVQNTTQDAMILQEYLKSYDVYKKVNNTFNLEEYYNSNDLDFIQRLYDFNSQEDYLELYNNHLLIVYDQTSNISKLSFLHVDNVKAKKIVNFLIKEAESRLNFYNKQSANKQLVFIQDETKKQKIMMEDSILELEKYQNTQRVIDPNTQVETNIAILSSLKAKLIEAQAKFEKLNKYLTNSSFEIVDLKREISQIKKSIKKIKQEQSGKNKKTLNKTIFEYETIKAKVELNQELYKQALLQLQSSKIEVIKENKNLQIIVSANTASSYSEPKKFRELITVILVLSLIYGILSMIIAIVKDHRE
jgi:capsular polysaccharide transport system permease protein